MRIVGSLIAALVLVGTPSPALGQRALPVPADKGWQHAGSGVILTARLAGLPRTALEDLSDREQDVVAEFATPGSATVATIYIFHPAMTSVPVWFDRAQTELMLKKVYGGVDPSGIAPAAFVPPGGTTASGLRQTYRPRGGAYAGTALAMAPVGEWLVAIRLSSTTLAPALLDAQLTDVIGAIRWPKASGGETAVPVGACADRLAFRHAKVRKPDMAQSLLGTILAGAVKDKTDGPPPPPWCREEIAPNALYGVYRRSGTSDGYTLAIADSGRIAGVYPAFALPGVSSGGGYQVTATALDGSVATYPTFDALPEPKQVADLILSGKAAMRSVSRNGKTNIYVDPGTK